MIASSTTATQRNVEEFLLVLFQCQSTNARSFGISTYGSLHWQSNKHYCCRYVSFYITISSPNEQSFRSLWSVSVVGHRAVSPSLSFAVVSRCRRQRCVCVLLRRLANRLKLYTAVSLYLSVVQCVCLTVRSSFVCSRSDSDEMLPFNMHVSCASSFTSITEWMLCVISSHQSFYYMYCTV